MRHRRQRAYGMGVVLEPAVMGDAAVPLDSTGDALTLPGVVAAAAVDSPAAAVVVVCGPVVATSVVEPPAAVATAASAGFSVVATAPLGGRTRSSSVGSMFSHFLR